MSAPPAAAARSPDAHRERSQARLQGRADPPQAEHAVHALERRRLARVPLPPRAGRLPRRADRRRQHGHDRHDGDGARAGRVRDVDRPAQALRGGRARRVLRGARAQVGRVLLDGHHEGRRGAVRPRDGGGGQRQRRGGALCVHRRRQRLHGELRALRGEDPRAVSAPRHHGRQRRDRRDDRGADPFRRRHREGRDRSRLGVHDAQHDRRGLSAAVGDHRVRRCGARARGPHLRRRRLHDARRRARRRSPAAPTS